MNIKEASLLYMKLPQKFRDDITSHILDHSLEGKESEKFLITTMADLKKLGVV